MIIRPFTFLMRFALKTLIRHAGLPSNFVSLFTVLFTTSTFLYRTIGIIPTLSILNQVRLALLNPSVAVAGLETILRQGTRLTATQLGSLIKLISPFLDDCLKYPKAFNRLFYVFNMLLTLSSFGPLIRYTLKTSVGLIFTSIGVLWNESLSGIAVLKDISLYILDHFESLLGFKVPLKDLESGGSEAAVATAEVEPTGYMFTIAGLVLLGLVIPLAGLCITHHYYPGVVDQIPYGNAIVQALYERYRTGMV